MQPHYFIPEVNARATLSPGTADSLAIGSDDQWCINGLNVPVAARGAGYGRALLRMILHDADASGVILTLAPYATGQWYYDADKRREWRGLKQRALEQWYRRYGFVWIGGRSSGMGMKRLPGTPIPRPRRHLGEPLASVRYLTTGQFAKAIQVSPRAVIGMVDSGRVDFCKFGGVRLLIPETELQRPEFAQWVLPDRD